MCADPDPSIQLNSVDELERVAAMYLLRPNGSMYHSSTAVADDRFADDGSVYIYREESGSSPDARGDEEEERSGGSEEGRSCRNQTMLAGDVDMDQRDRWEEDVDEVSASAVIQGSSNSRDRHQMAPDDYRAGTSYDRSGKGVNVVPGEQSAGRGGGGDVAAGIHHRDRSSEGEGQVLQQPPESSDSRQASTSGAGGGDCLIRGAYAPHGGGPGKGIDSALVDDCGSRPDRSRREDASLEALDMVPGASVPRRAGGDGASREACGGNAATVSDRKVEQIAATLREMILDRQTTAGRSIRQVFGHFDRRRCGYVNVSEMRDALVDLRLNVSPDQAKVSR